MMSAALCSSNIEQSNVQNWSEEDVSNWLESLNLSDDYSSRIKEMSINGEFLLHSNCTTLSSTIGITCIKDRHSLSQAINKLLRMQQTTPTDPSHNATPNGYKYRNQSHLIRSSGKARSLDELLDETVKLEVSEPVGVASPAHHQSYLFDVLRAENISLKRELETYYDKVYRLQKLELELQQLQDSYSLLEGTSNRKAKFEKVMRERLEEDLLRMKQTQAQQKAELYSIRRTTNKWAEPVTGDGSIGGKSLATAQYLFDMKDKEIVIEKLLQQNEEAISLRQKLENNLLFAKSALDCNHGNKTKRKSESEPLRRKPSPPENNGVQNIDLASTYLNNLEGLQLLLTAMQSSSDNRQKLEQQLRTQLQERVVELEAGIDSHREQTEDQALRIATLEADLAQMEEKCAQLMAEKQLDMNEMRQSQLSLLEHHCSAKEAELNALKGQRDMCMKQLEEAHLAIARQEKKLLSLEAVLQERQQSLQPHPPPSLDELLYHNGGGGGQHVNPSTTSRHGNRGIVQSLSSHCIRRTSSPLPPGYTTHLSGLAPPTTVTAPPTLPSYNQHLHTRYNQQFHRQHSPVSHNYNDISNSNSFPNTPEVSRRHIMTTPYYNTAGTASLTPSQGTRGEYKSLTPPPIHYPPKPRPTLVSSQSLTHNGITRQQDVGGYYAADNDSVDSFELLLSSSSPASLSPPTRYQMGRAGSFGSSAPGYTHEHSNSFPYK